MSTRYLQDFVDKTRQYKTSFFCIAASCCSLMAAQPQTAAAATTDNPPTKKAPERVKQQISDINEKMKSCSSKSMMDRLSDRRAAVEHEVFSTATTAMVLAGTDLCPGTNIPAGTSFSDTGTTLGSTNTVNGVNTSCIQGVSVFYTNPAGPDQIYKFVLPALGSRIATCTIGVTSTGGYDAEIYYLSVGGGGCPVGTGNVVTNCIKGRDTVLGNGTETITDAQMDATPAGTYFLFIDSFYCGPDGSLCDGPDGSNECPGGNAVCFRGSYTLNFNCTTLAPTAALVGVGGRVVTADGRGISGAKVTAVLPSGEARTMITNPFGFYHFDDLEAGNAYVFQAEHKQFQFPSGAQLITVNDAIENLDFVAGGSSRPRDTKPQ
ncbi:MAG TPA: carboxypeptidase-like regulatory domain-containing protein [Pyrinomonadaceae bacterium]|jgi:hypothetical protein|nr:carboxypeptidase-like regulatory domain-containing protein [Pyrinomonadaceae bacterium]